MLSELRIDLAPFIAGTSIVGVALGFGAQNIVKDFLSGMFMMLEDQYGVGDVIDFEKASGTVEAVGLRTTRLRDVNGTVWYVRNGEVVRVGNKSQGFAQVVLDVPIDAWRRRRPGVARRCSRWRRQMRGEEDWSAVFLERPGDAGRRGDDPRGDRDPAGRAGARPLRAVARGRARAAPARSATRLRPPRHRRAAERRPRPSEAPATPGGGAEPLRPSRRSPSDRSWAAPDL